jgi:hypothetical protein
MNLRKMSKAPETADFLHIPLQRLYEICRTDPTFPKTVLGRRQYRFNLEAVGLWANNGGSANRGKNGEK